MISTKELMLGNWVYEGELTKFPMQVVGIGTDYVYLDFEGNEGDIWEERLEDMHGIPLTGELLTKIGFIECGPTLYQYQKGDIDVAMHLGLRCTIERRLSGILLASFASESPRYLHQLQNAFRLTTNKELKINLWK